MNKQNHYNLKTRLFAVISTLIFVSVFFVSSISALRFSKVLIDQTTEQTQQLIDQIALNTSNYISEISRLCMSPYYSEQVMKLLETAPETNVEMLEKQRTIENYLREVMTIPRRDILRVNILTDRAYSSSRTGHIPPYLKDYTGQDWYQLAVENDKAIFVPSYVESYGSYKVTAFSMALRLQSLSDSKNTLGVIRVDANYSGIKDVLDDVELLPQGALYIFDTSGNVIYGRSKLPSEVVAGDIFRAGLQNSSPIPFSVGKERYRINTQIIDGTDWFVTEVNAESVMMHNVYSLQRFAVLSAVLCVIFGLVATAFFVRSFVRPIHETVDVMRMAQRGDLAVRAPESSANEIDYLNQAFNEMLQKISDTMDHNSRLSREMYEAKYLQKKAQYNALYNQIRPHFLFNTLSTISLLIKSRRDKEAIQSIDELSVLLRGMVDTDKDISLAAELKIAESYLSLQARRHDSLIFSISIDDQIVDSLLPALTVQPIVENALIHGCEPSQRDMQITVAAVLEGDTIIITVIDNGIGMEKDQLLLLRDTIEGHTPESVDSESRSVGLRNIDQRIRLRFGDEYGISIDSLPNQGTTVSLKIPFTSSNGGKQW